MEYSQDTGYIQHLIAEGEHQHQDFKFAISDARKIAKSLSAFANTEGGRLLVGVKDNGRIAGIHFEEEMYMIEAAAELYCTPKVDIKYRIYKIEGKDILEVQVPESSQKPVYAIDQEKRKWAYVRIDDENILASPVHLQIWKHTKQEEKVCITYTDAERHLLEILNEYDKLTFNQCCKLSKMERRKCCQLLADFIRFGLISILFDGHIFYFQLKSSE